MTEIQGNTDYHGPIQKSHANASPETPVHLRHLPDSPPVQRDEAWLGTASPKQMDDAYNRFELHVYMGGEVDAEGWPLGTNGKRLDVHGETR